MNLFGIHEELLLVSPSRISVISPQGTKLDFQVLSGETNCIPLTEGAPNGASANLDVT